MKKIRKIEDSITKDVRNLFKLKKRVIEDTGIKDIRNLFRLKKMKQSKKEIIRDMRNILVHKKKIITNQQEWVIFGAIILLNMKVMVIAIKHYQLKNNLIKLDYT